MIPRIDALRDPVLEKALHEARHNGSQAQIYAFQRVSSTMEIAHELAVAGAAEGTLLWAVRQDQGRGRLGRTWESPEGGLYCSLILRPNRPQTDIPQLSLVAGLAVVEGIRQLAQISPSIRWPNDVLIDEKKVCGILVEVRDGAVVVGIGINVTTKLSDLPSSATSLHAAMASHSNLRPPTSDLLFPLTGALCRRFQAWYDEWSAHGFGPIREALRPWIGLFGHPVHIIAGSRHVEGTATDVDEAGRLVVRLDSGILRQFEMGEVTLLR